MTIYTLTSTTKGTTDINKKNTQESPTKLSIPFFVLSDIRNQNANCVDLVHPRWILFDSQVMTGVVDPKSCIPKNRDFPDEKIL